MIVVGMHRSGTSAVARGLQALSVYLGRDFLDAQPENPTGYWEDKGVVEINERVLKTLGLRWDDASPIARERFRAFRIRMLRAAAARYVKRTFGSQPLWGFKDPRTIRLLPFWQGVFQRRSVEDSYVVVIRNPRSVAASLFRRQAMDSASAHRLWLVHMVPFLRDLRNRPMVVVDYDLLMLQPRAQLERIAGALDLPLNSSNVAEVDRFAGEFLDETLRHSTFSPNEPDLSTTEGRLTHEAYARLYALAGELRPDAAEFWNAWESIERAFERLNQPY
jgi:hypothetical protein